MQQNSPLRYTNSEQQKIKMHIQRHFGPILGVMRELISPDLCIDVYIVSPTEKRPYYLYITVGMGAYKMETGRVELLMTIPSYWDIHSDEGYFYWPARFMKQAARFPIITGNNLLPRHTINNNGKTFDPSTEFSAMLISLPLVFNKNSTVCKLGKGETIQFLQLLPIYKEELAFIKKHGAGNFIARTGVDLLGPLNLMRENFYKRKKTITPI